MYELSIETLLNRLLLLVLRLIASLIPPYVNVCPVVWNTNNKEMEINYQEHWKATVPKSVSDHYQK